MFMHAGLESVADTLVIGAGLAGLVVAYRLTQAGLPVDVIEARDRPGGRIHSLSQALGTTLTAELGGEVFDSDHAACLNLALELGLPLVDLWQQMSDYTSALYWFGESALSSSAVEEEFTALLRERSADRQAVQRFMRHPETADEVYHLDQQSIPDYLAARGASQQLQQVVSTAYTIRYGLDAAAQSCLNLLAYFRTLEDCVTLFGSSDERFYLQGGNAQLTQALFQTVADRVQLGTALEAITATSDGRFCVSVRQGQTIRDRLYSRVVLTVPFSVLRHLSLRVALPPRQQQAIATLSYNSPTKLISAYRYKPWQTFGSNGLVYTDLPFQHCWEASDSLQSDQESLLVAYTGGQEGKAIAAQDLMAATQQTIQDLDRIFPGLHQAQLTPEALRSDWMGDPFSYGAYSCYTVGQWTTFHGCEGERVGHLFFAGEHCSRRYQGYMEGACETAEQVVLKILQDVDQTAAAQCQHRRLQRYRQLRSQGFHLTMRP